MHALCESSAIYVEAVTANDVEDAVGVAVGPGGGAVGACVGGAGLVGMGVAAAGGLGIGVTDELGLALGPGDPAIGPAGELAMGAGEAPTGADGLPVMFGAGAERSGEAPSEAPPPLQALRPSVATRAANEMPAR